MAYWIGDTTLNNIFLVFFENNELWLKINNNNIDIIINIIVFNPKKLFLWKKLVIKTSQSIKIRKIKYFQKI